jgi:hypothetical protein
MSVATSFDLSTSSRVVESIINELYRKYDPLVVSSCLVMHEFARAIGSQLSFSKKLFYYLKSSSYELFHTGVKEHSAKASLLSEQKFIDTLTELCKNPAKVYDHTYYSIIRLLWIRFKETERLDDNPNLTKLFRLLDYSMNYPLIYKVNYLVHNVAKMLYLHPEAVAISYITIISPTLPAPPALPAPSAPPVPPTLPAPPAPTPVQQEENPTNTTETNSKECPVCMTNEKDTALIDCGHVICNMCTTHIQGTTKKCPICRKIFTNTFKIYL